MHNENLLLAILRSSASVPPSRKDLIKHLLITEPCDHDATGMADQMKMAFDVLAAVAEDDDLFNTLNFAHTRLKLDKLSRVRKLKGDK